VCGTLLSHSSPVSGFHVQDAESCRPHFIYQLSVERSKPGFLHGCGRALFDDGQLEYRTRLVAFRHIIGSYSGENFAREFFMIVDELGISTRYGITTTIQFRHVAHTVTQAGWSDYNGQRIKQQYHDGRARENLEEERDTF